MPEANITQLQALTDQLNRYRYEYYSLNAPTVSDEVYDRLFDELGRLERETGIRMGNSPTQTVGWLAARELLKAAHPIPPAVTGKNQAAGRHLRLCRRPASAAHAQTGRPDHQGHL